MSFGTGLGLLFGVVALFMLGCVVMCIIDEHRRNRSWKRTILFSLVFIGIIVMGILSHPATWE